MKLWKYNRFKWTFEVKNRLCEAQNHKCCYCGIVMDYDNPLRSPTFEHIKPKRLCSSIDEWDNIDNVVIACKTCNCLKADKPPERYYRHALVREAQFAIFGG